jgi:hypothetical protein
VHLFQFAVCLIKGDEVGRCREYFGLIIEACREVFVRNQEVKNFLWS